MHEDDLIWILVSAMLVNNFTLVMFLGLCPFMGVTGRWPPRCAWARRTSSCW